MKIKYFKKFWFYRKLFKILLSLIFPPFYFLWMKKKKRRRNARNRTRIKNTYGINPNTWYKKSKKLRKNNLCEKCRSEKNLTVHHGIYLQVLCDNCHKKEHILNT